MKSVNGLTRSDIKPLTSPKQFSAISLNIQFRRVLTRLSHLTLLCADFLGLVPALARVSH